MLAVETITKRFGGLVAVNAASLNVAAGSITGLIGPNGAGKTTLFALISGFLPIDSGEVRFEGQRINGVPPHHLVRRGLVRSFQIVQTFADMTTLDVVATAALVRRPLREAIDFAAHTLKRVGLGGKELLTPASLSLQDKKLLEVAKCVATEPRFILLDEVMAGLTMAETEAPIAAIRDLHAQGATIVMVEHVMPVIMRLATKMVLPISQDKPAEGTPAEIVEAERAADAGDHAGHRHGRSGGDAYEIEAPGVEIGVGDRAVDRERRSDVACGSCRKRHHRRLRVGGIGDTQDAGQRADAAIRVGCGRDHGVASGIGGRETAATLGVEHHGNPVDGQRDRSDVGEARGAGAQRDALTGLDDARRRRGDADDGTLGAKPGT